MSTIWKFQFDIVNPLSISMPSGAQILSVQDQDGVPCMWAMVNPEKAAEMRYFEIFRTGQPMCLDKAIERRFIGTFQQPPFEWHVFERIVWHLFE